MKTLYLLFAMFFISIGSVCKAQQGYYELYIYYKLHNNTSNDCECESRMQITIHMKDKATHVVSQEIIKKRMLRIDKYDSNEEKLWYVFPTSKEIVKIEFYTRRDYHKGLWNNCVRAADGTWTVSNITYPEFAAHGNPSNIQGYGNSLYGSTVAVINIRPLTNKKLLTLDMELREPQDFDFDFYEAKIDGTTRFFSPRQQQHVSANARELQTAYYVPENPSDISKININLRKSIPQQDELSFTGKLPPPKGGTPVVVESAIKNISGNPIFTAKYQLIHAPLKVPEDTIFTNVGNMTLEATGGFPENSISWAYYVGDPTTYPSWIKFPDRLQKKNKITFTAQEIGLTDAQIGKKVNFVYMVGTGWRQESEIRRYTFMKKAPAITDYQAFNATCSYRKDGSLAVQFDRALEDGERLNFVVVKINKDDPTVRDDYSNNTWENISKLDDNNCFTLEPFEQGSYTIKIIAKMNEEAEISNDFVSFDIGSPAQVEFNAEPIDVNCYNGHDGRIVIDASGGTEQYWVMYSIPDSEMDSLCFTGKDTIGGLTHGTYTLRVYDTNGCHAGNQENVDPPVTHTLTAPAAGTILVQDHTNTKPPRGSGLTDGTIHVHADRGVPGYSFIWKKNGEDFTKHQQNDSSSKADQTVGDGLYHIRVQDSHYAAAMSLNSEESNIRGCYDTISIRIIEPPRLEVMLAVKDSILCNGDANGSIVARAWGGVPYAHTDAPYRYEWSLLRPFQDDRDTILNELYAGTYRVTVIDGNGITDTVTYTLTQPDVLQASATGNTILCDGDTDGRVEALVTGGTGSYRYRWSSAHAEMDGDTRVVENLTGGKYVVEVTDHHRCITVATGEVSVPRGMQTPDTVSVPPLCHDASDGKIIMPVTGGAGSYRYLWNTGAVTPNISGIPAGRYSVRVTDANNCFVERRFSLSNPAPLSVNIGPDLTLCREQSAMLSAAIPDPRASYRWFNRYGLFHEEPEAVVASAGEYRVAVTDGNGCTGGDTVTVSVSEAEIAADFVAAAKAACTIPACFVNISYPTSDRVEWLVPDDPSILVMSRDEQQLELRFNSEGTYRIGLRSGVGSCEKTVYRDVTVVGKYELTEYEPQQEAFLKQFKLWPNPNSGQFTVLAELSETADIQLRLISSAGVVNELRQLTGSDRYEELFSTEGKLNAGVYILQLVSKKAVAAIQVVIN